MLCVFGCLSFSLPSLLIAYFDVCCFTVFTQPCAYNKDRWMNEWIICPASVCIPLSLTDKQRTLSTSLTVLVETPAKQNMYYSISCLLYSEMTVNKARHAQIAVIGPITTVNSRVIIKNHNWPANTSIPMTTDWLNCSSVSDTDGSMAGTRSHLANSLPRLFWADLLVKNSWNYMVSRNNDQKLSVTVSLLVSANLTSVSSLEWNMLNR